MDKSLDALVADGRFQASVQPWLIACFGELIAGDREERNHRFLEEALELVQSLRCTASESHQLVDYVYGRPMGHPPQEVGGVMVTLAALCLANDLDMHAAGWVELDRIWGKVEQIRAKQAAKPKHSPLPIAAEQSTPAGMVMVPIEEAAVLCARLEHDASYDKCGHGYYRLKTALSAAPDPAKPVSCTCQRYPTHCANDCPEHGLDEPTYTAGERVDVPPVSPTIPEGMVADEPCSLGVGCDEAGVCYADALGQPDKCGRKPVSTPRVTEIADIIRAYNPKPCGVEWPRNAAVAILQALSTEKQG